MLFIGMCIQIIKITWKNIKNRFLYQNVYIIQIMYLLFERKILILVQFKEKNSKNLVSNCFFPKNEPEHDLNVFLNFWRKTSLVIL